MSDWTDTYKKDRANGPIITSRPARTTLPQRGNKRVLKPSKPTATVSAASKSRRRSVTGTDNTRHNSGGNNMPVKTTRKSPAAKTTTRRAAAKPEAVEGLVLSLEKMPAAKGGIKYSDAADHEEKLNITSMYLSQEAVAAHFGGEIPETITVS